MSLKLPCPHQDFVPRIITPDGKWRRHSHDRQTKGVTASTSFNGQGRGYWRNWATDGELNSWRDDGVNHAGHRLCRNSNDSAALNGRPVSLQSVGHARPLRLDRCGVCIPT